ncbi:MAG: hypothetical protein HYY02_06370 [Chloroflexi bacterium]|nr:hypothetical protein [Chloroflexota bacterium]
MPTPSFLQFSRLQGAVQEDGPYTMAQRLDQEGDAGYLFLLIEALGSVPEETGRAAAETFWEAFQASRLSLTGRLQEALRAVHQRLLLEDRDAPPEHRSTVGAACACLRQGDLYLAHAGPTLAYLVGPESTRRLAPAPGSPASGLGGLAEPRVWVRHHHLAQGEVLLVASSTLAEVGGERELFAAFRHGWEEGMVEVYRRSSAYATFAALAVNPWVAPEPARPERSPQEAAAETVSSGEPYAHGRREPWRTATGPVPLPEPYLMQDTSLPLGLNVAGPRRWVSRYARGLLPPQVLAGLLGVFILGGLLVGVTSLLQRAEQAARSEAAALVQAATDLQGQAQGAATRDLSRQLLNQALSKLQTALRQDSASRETAALVAQVREALARLDAVQELRDFRTPLDLTGAAAGAPLLRDIVAPGGAIYLLDKVGDQVIQVTPALQGGGAGASPVYLVQPSGSARRNLAGLLWLPRGGAWPRDSLLAVDDGRGLLEFDPSQGVRTLPLRGTGEWASFQAAAGFAGSLYILDPKASQVWRYLATERGFDSERRATLPSMDLRDAVDLGVDGDTYLLLRTGKVLKFSNGRAQPFSPDGLDRPLLNPVALHASAESIYVSDAGNRRIVVFDKADGRFLRQFPVPQLPQIHHLWADEARSLLYLVTDTRLYSAVMPRS